MSAEVACMGGWCTSRGHCADYWAGDESTWPDRIVERKCPKGQDNPRELVLSMAIAWLGIAAREAERANGR